MTIPVAPTDGLPRVLFIEQLSALIGKTATTIRTCATNAKYQHLIPRPFKMPHSRRLCWYEHDVRAWIDANHEPSHLPTRRPRGRPTKAQQLAWQRQATESRSPTKGAQ
jgi:predicted DNA-binding transcriptional regulator AlpA